MALTPATIRMDPRGSKVAAMEAELAKQAAARGLTGERAQAYIYGTLNKMGYMKGSKATRKGATKAKRSDALTPAILRLDLKCGKGAISEGEKCTKGAAQRVQPKKGNKARSSGVKKALMAGAAIGGGAALLGAGLKMRSQRRERSKAVLNMLKGTKRSANEAFAKQLDIVAKANREDPGNRELQQAAVQVVQMGKRNRALKRANVKAGLAALKRSVPKSPARRRAARRRGDSIYADGFSPELGQLAV